MSMEKNPRINQVSKDITNPVFIMPVYSNMRVAMSTRTTVRMNVSQDLDSAIFCVYSPTRFLSCVYNYDFSSVLVHEIV